MLVLTLNNLHITPYALSNHCLPTSNRSFVLMREVKVTEEGHIVYKNEMDNTLPSRFKVNNTYRICFYHFFLNIINQLSNNQDGYPNALVLRCIRRLFRTVRTMIPPTSRRFITNHNIIFHLRSMKNILFREIHHEINPAIQAFAMNKINSIISDRNN